MSLPPKSVYPLAIDSDYTLFQVYNTSEAKLTADNAAWAEEVDLVPVGADKPEVWADNGFANLDGELFYYDSVDKNANGKIFRLKRCARNLGGTATHFNPVGEWVRGFVIAEHHNILVDAIIEIEKRAFALKIALDELDLPECTDDFNCVDVTFNLEVPTDITDPCIGTTVTYNVDLNGTVQGAQIDFGDGQSTTDLQGVHVYAPNTIIDPIVTVQNDNCVVVQTPITKTTEKITEPTINEPPMVPIPEIPAFPPMTFGPINPPSTTLTFPPIIFPCLEGVGGTFPSIYISMNIVIPSIITIVPGIPSIITIVGEIPGQPILPSMISIGPGPDIPPIISFTPVFIPSIIDISMIPIDVNVNTNINVTTTVIESIPRVIYIEPQEISVVGMIALPPIITIRGPYPALPSVINFGPTPDLTVSWGNVPSLTCNCTLRVECPSVTGSTPLMAQNFDDYFEDSFFNQSASVEAQVSDLGIPSEIRIIPPTIPDLELKHNLPTSIELKVPVIPDIRIIGPERELPNEIRIISDEIPRAISVESSIPENITVDASSVPNVIYLQQVKPLPETIFIDGSSIPREIRVVGMPDSIELKHNLPEYLELRLPENLEVPLVYKGGPIPIEFTSASLSGEGDADQPCFMITPCPRR